MLFQLHKADIISKKEATIDENPGINGEGMSFSVDDRNSVINFFT